MGSQEHVEPPLKEPLNEGVILFSVDKSLIKDGALQFFILCNRHNLDLLQENLQINFINMT